MLGFRRPFFLLFFFLLSSQLLAQRTLDDFLKDYNRITTQSERQSTLLREFNQTAITAQLLAFIEKEIQDSLRAEFELIEQLLSKTTLSYYQLSLPLLSSATLAAHTHTIGWFLPGVSLSFISGMHIILPFGAALDRQDYDELYYFRGIVNGVIQDNGATFTLPTYALFLGLKFRIQKSVSKALNKWQFAFSYASNGFDFFNSLTSLAIKSAGASIGSISIKTQKFGLGVQYFIWEQNIFSSSLGVNLSYILHNFNMEYPYSFEASTIAVGATYKTKNKIYTSGAELSWAGGVNLKWIKPFFSLGGIVTIASDEKKTSSFEYSATTLQRDPQLTIKRKIYDYTISTKAPVFTPLAVFGTNLLYALNVSFGFSLLRNESFVDSTSINVALNLDL